MPKRKNKRSRIYESKSAEKCPCSCCRWHSSKALKSVLAAMFILIVVAGGALIFYPASTYLEVGAMSFVGIILVVVFVGWGVSLSCSCKGIHWARHGYALFDSSKLVAKDRYARGEISRKEFENMMNDLQ